MATYELLIPRPSGSEHELVARMEALTRHFDAAASIDGSALVRALSNVSFAVFRGEVLGLLGPRGSGKSTTLRILAGQLRPSEGKVKVFGRSPRRRRIQSRIGYLPDDADRSQGQFLTQLIGFLRDFVSRTKKNDPAVAEAPTAGSRRSRLTRMLLKNPELVLLDEPFSGLDSVGCQEMKELIASLAQSGKTVILSGESLSYAMDVCSRLLLLSTGRVEASGTIAQLVDRPDALRLLGQLLPQPTAHRVLQILREDLLLPKNQDVASEAEAEQRRQPSSRPSLPQPSRSKPSADEILGTLLKPAPIEHACRPPGERRPSVNHDLLTALTRPPSASPPATLAKD